MPQTLIVQYVPDAVTNERINIGVIVLDENRASAAFLSNWGRVKQFAGRDIQFLQDLQHDSRHWDAEAVLRFSQQWTGFMVGDTFHHKFDVTVANGKPYFAAQGISFEVPETRFLEKELSSTA